MNNSSNNKNNKSEFDFESIQSRRQSPQNPYATSFREDNAYHNRSSGRYEPQSSRRKVRKQQSQIKFNWGALIFIFIIAIVVTVSVVQLGKNPKVPENDDYIAPPVNDTAEPLPDNDNPPVETDNHEGENSETVTGDDNSSDKSSYKSFTAEVNWSEEDDGDLILVNYDHDYSENADYIPVVNIYEKRSTDFKVAGTNIQLSPLAFEAFEEMVNGLEEATGCDDLIVNSGYRTIQDQKDTYDYYVEEKGSEYAQLYVAEPGKSEHHTGYALDLSFYLDEGYSENVGIHEHGAWLTEHCTDYGFIVRYPEDKVEYTHIAYEAWHFRYVGTVHAKAMASLGYCLEEYIDLLDDCTLDDKVLYLSDDGKASLMYTDTLPTDSGYAIYSVPATDSNKTELTILGEEGADYSYSGTNAGFFVVTVPLGEK